MSYKFEFETQGAAAFLVYKKEESDVIDTMAMGMISNNKIDGVLPFIYGQVNEDTFFKYNVSSQSTLKKYFSGGVTKKRFLKVLESLLDCFILSEEYMLEMSSIILDLDYIFVDANTATASVVVLPLVIDEENSVEDFVRTLLFSTQFDQTGDCSYIAALLSFLNSNQFFSIHKLKELVQELSKEKAVVKVQQEEKQSVTVATVVQPQVETVREVVPPTATPSKIPESPKAHVLEIDKPAPVKSERNLEIPNSKKEKKSLFGKKEKKEKADSKSYKDMPAPPPFIGAGKSEPEAPKKEKKSLFGSKEKEPKKSRVSRIAIPGVETPASVQTSKQPAQSVVETVRTPVKEKQASASTSQTVIPTQQVEMQKHTVQVQNFGETTVLTAPNYGETTVLSVDAAPMVRIPYLIRTKNNEKIPVNTTEFRIGREPSYANYCIRDNSAISGSHANIITRDGQYFLVDTNSRNHSYVNGQMIPCNQEVQIKDGDKIRLANEDFTFQLM